MKPTTRPTTIRQLNNAIQKEFPNVLVRKGYGYFYLYSEDEDTANKICSLYSSSIYINSLSGLTLEGWLNEIRSLLK